MAKQTSLFDEVRISLIFGFVWAGLTDNLFVWEVCNRLINSHLLCEACIWSTDLHLVLFWELHYIGNCIALGFTLFWEFWNCIILWIVLLWKLYCIRNCSVLIIGLYWDLHCIGNCILLKIALYRELHCIEHVLLLS